MQYYFKSYTDEKYAFASPGETSDESIETPSSSAGSDADSSEVDEDHSKVKRAAKK